LVKLALDKTGSYWADAVEAREFLMLNRIVVAAVLTTLLAAGGMCGAQAQQPTSSGQQVAGPSGWTFNIAPYMWLPTINTTLNNNLPPALDGRVPTELSAGPGEILRHLNFATMVAADAQYGRFSVLTDFLYMNVSATSSQFRSIDFTGQPSQTIVHSLQDSTGTSLNSKIWTLAGGYTVMEGDWGNFDVIAGFRYLALNTTTDFSLALAVTGPRGNGATFGGFGSVSGSGTIWNGIGGFRGRIRINNTGFFIPYYFDIGAGGSNLTWQIASGLGYQTGWAGVSLTYRHLSFEQGSSAVIEHLAMGGPMIMVNFSF
jgi:hypothetical protein